MTNGSAGARRPGATMRGKYTNPFSYHLAKLRRAPMLAMLRRQVEWQPMADPQPGYTPIIGCMAAIPEIALANVRLMSRMDMPNAKEVILVFDRPARLMPEGFAEKLEDARGDMPVRLLHYTDEQHAAAERIRWGWVYAWMSWTTGIANASTRHVILHDLDAMPIDPSFFERRYKLAEQNGATFFGIRWYRGNGLDESDRLTTTFEMVMDAARVREAAEPFEAFNHIKMFNGKSVDFDTFLYMQSRIGGADQAPIDETDVVHPSQMICQYTDLLAGRNTHAMPTTNLPLMPAYMLLGGRADLLETMTDHLDREGSPRVPFLGRTLDVSKITPTHLDWLEKQARRLDEAATGAVRPEIDRYLALLRRGIEST
ncbi:MAG: hypothetical protein AAFR96_04110 [Planctomycetota bacterium]